MNAEQGLYVIIMSMFPPFKLCWLSFCDFRLQKVQGAKHRTQLLPPNEMYADEQGPHRQCQISNMEGKAGVESLREMFCCFVILVFKHFKEVF